MKWISTKDELPKEGKYVLARHTRGTWHDIDQENVNCVVVKLVRGISLEEREKMKKGILPDVIEERFTMSASSKSYKRSDIYYMEDEGSNNRRAYYWDMFGPDSFYGQDISHWTPIDPL